MKFWQTFIRKNNLTINAELVRERGEERRKRAGGGREHMYRQTYAQTVLIFYRHLTHETYSNKSSIYAYLLHELQFAFSFVTMVTSTGNG